MRARDIKIDEHYAVAPRYCYNPSKYAKRGQVIAKVGSKWRVRFRSPMSEESWRLKADKAAGQRELVLDSTYFRSTWNKHTRTKKHNARQGDILRGAVEELHALLGAQGAELQSFEHMWVETGWTHTAGVPVADIELSCDTLLTLIKALAEPNAEQDDVIGKLLGETR